MVGMGSSVESGGLTAVQSAGHLEPKFYPQLYGIVQFSVEAGGVCFFLTDKVLLKMPPSDCSNTLCFYWSI